MANWLKAAGQQYRDDATHSERLLAMNHAAMIAQGRRLASEEDLPSFIPVDDKGNDLFEMA